jgi:hypothetical protein
MRTAILLTQSLTAIGLYVSLALGAPSAAAIVDLGYATYQGILVQDPVTNQTNTNFLGVRDAAPPTGAPEVDLCHSPFSKSYTELFVIFDIQVQLGSARPELQPPPLAFS